MSTGRIYFAASSSDGFTNVQSGDLVIEGASNTTIHIGSDNSSNTSSLQIASDKILLGNVGGSGNSGLVITSAGVGVGVSNPTCTLDVAGVINATTVMQNNVSLTQYVTNEINTVTQYVNTSIDIINTTVETVITSNVSNINSEQVDFASNAAIWASNMSSAAAPLSMAEYGSNTAAQAFVIAESASNTASAITSVASTANDAATTAAFGSNAASFASNTSVYASNIGRWTSNEFQNYLPVAGGTVTGALTIGGNLIVTGSTTSVNTQTMLIDNNKVTLNSSFSNGTPPSSLQSGLEVRRGSESNYYLVFEELTDLFKIGKSTNLQALATRTDNLTSGYPYYDAAQTTMINRDITPSDITGLSATLTSQATTGQWASNIASAASNTAYTASRNTQQISFSSPNRTVMSGVTQAQSIQLSTDGSAAIPAFTWVSDSNTGIYHPGADQMGLSVGSNVLIFLNSNANLGLGGSTDPKYPVDVKGILNASTLYQNGSPLSNVYASYSMGVDNSNIAWEAFHNTERIKISGDPTSYEYPPAAMFNSNVTLSNLAYGNGTYVITTDGYGGSNQAYNAFNKVLTDQWTSYGGFSGGSNYSRPSKTINGVSYPGPWIAIQLPDTLFLDGYDLTPFSLALAPKKFFIFAKNTEDLDWTLIDTRTNLSTGWTSQQPRKFTVPGTTMAYNNFMFLTTDIIATGGYTFRFSEWRLYGRNSEGGISVSGTVSTYDLTLTANGSTSRPALSWSTDTHTGIYHPGGDQIAFSVQNSNVLFLNSNGNVGIGGTLNPQHKLDVKGNINATGTIYTTSLLENGVSLSSKMQNMASFSSPSTVYEYPPLAMAGSNYTLSNNAYGNGRYVVTADSELNTSTKAYLVFNKVTTAYTSFWSPLYSYPSGGSNYGGTPLTINGQTYQGASLTLNMDTAIYLNSYELISSATGFPKTFYLFGKNTGDTDWTLVDSQINVSSWPDWTGKTFTPATNTAFFSSYMFVFTVVNGNVLRLTEIKLYAKDTGGINVTGNTKTHGLVLQNAGSVYSPTITWADDSNTGIYHPGHDQLAIVVSSNTAVFVNSNTFVGINKTNPQYQVDVAGIINASNVYVNGVPLTLGGSNADVAALFYSSNTATAASNAAFAAYGSNSGIFGSNTAVFASNAAVFGSNAGAFGSNAARFSSNAGAFGSNAGAFGSNAGAFGSNAGTFGSNTAVFGSNAAVFGSNAGVFGSNMAVSALTAANGAFNTANMANDAASYASVAAEFGSNLAVTASVTADWSSNVVTITSNAVVEAQNVAVWASNASVDAGSKAEWTSNAVQNYLPVTGGSISGALMINGDLTVTGQTTTFNTQTVVIQDNILTLNSSLSNGTPPVTLQSGVEVMRGDEPKFYFMFEEATDLFKIGKSNELQAVTTRDDTMTDGYAYYNSTQKKLVNRALTTGDIADLDADLEFTSNASVFASNAGEWASNVASAASNVATQATSTAEAASNIAVGANSTAESAYVIATGSITTAEWSSNAIASTSNAVFPASDFSSNLVVNTSNSVFPSAAFSSNLVVNTSNSVFPSAAFSSNLVVNTSNSVFPRTVFNSNAAVFSSNLVVNTSNSVFSSAAFSSNIAVNTSNTLFPRSIFNSNAAVFSSNLSVNTSNTLFPRVMFNSNAAVFSSNLAVNTSNALFPSSTFSSNAVVWTSNITRFTSNSIMQITPVIGVTPAVSTNWRTQTTPGTTLWQSVCWSSLLSRFVAVGSSGSSNVMTSSDGATWTAAWVSDNSLKSVCWSPYLQMFAAVSTVGNIMTSSDGITWTLQTSPLYIFNSIYWSEDLRLFIACSSSSMLVSQNGTSWSVPNGAVLSSSGILSVCYSPQLRFFVGTKLSSIYSSYNIADTWYQRSVPSANWCSVCWSPELGLFAACANTSTTNSIVTSSDGISWSVKTCPTSDPWVNIIWSSEMSLFVVVSSSTTKIMTSVDGSTWKITDPGLNTSTAICWSPELSRFVNVSAAGTASSRAMTCSGIQTQVYTDNLYTTYSYQGASNISIKSLLATSNLANTTSVKTQNMSIAYDSSSLEYPPAPLWSSNSTLSNLPYGNGTYIIDQCFWATSNAFNIFDKNNTTFWLPGAFGAGGSNYGSALYVTVNGTSYDAPWVSIKLPEPIILDSYDLTPYTNGVAPKTFYIFGKNATDTDWTLLQFNDNVLPQSSWIANTPTRFTIANNTTAFSSYLFLTLAVYTNSGNFRFCEWRMYGRRYGTMTLTSIVQPNNIYLNVDGSTSNAALSWKSDSNTGLYHPNSKQLAVAINSSNMMFFNSNYNIGLCGHSNPQYSVDVIGTVNASTIRENGIQLGPKVTYLNQFYDSTLYEYPPLALPANTITFSNAPYGNGTYTVQADSENGVNYAWKAFTKSPGDQWITNSQFTGGSNYPTSVPNTSFSSGAYISISFNDTFCLESYEITPYGTVYPKTFYLLGKTDTDSTWTLLDTETNVTTGWANNTPRIFSVSNNSTMLNAYMLVVTELVQTSATTYRLSELKFNARRIGENVTGRLLTHTVHMKSYGNALYPSMTWSNNTHTGIYRAGQDQIGFATASNNVLFLNSNQYVGVGGNSNPQYTLDVTGTMNATVVRENGLQISSKINYLNQFYDSTLYEYPPLAIPANTVTFSNASYGNGTYTVQADSESATNYAWKAFNKNTADGWYTTLQFTGGSNYSTSNMYGGVWYNGPWINITFNDTFCLESYEITPIATNYPKTFYVFGRVDNDSNWTLLDTETNVTTGWANNTPRIFSVSNNSTMFNSYMLVVTEIVGTSATTYRLSELKFNARRIGENVTGRLLTHTVHMKSFGNVLYPSMTWSNNTHTGIYRAGKDQIGFTTASNNVLFLNSNRSIGVGGNSNPQYNLDILGTIGAFKNMTGSVADSSGNSNLTGRIFFTDSNGLVGETGVRFASRLNSNDYKPFSAFNNGLEVVSVRNSNVGIGVTAPIYTLHLNTDSAAKTATNTWSVTSDQRIKENIVLADIDRCYEIVKTLDLKRYTWKDEFISAEMARDRSKLGWIAQEVETVFPKAVDTVDMYGISDCKTLNSDQIYAVMYGAIKKLQQMGEAQALEITELKTQLSNLQASSAPP